MAQYDADDAANTHVAPFVPQLVNQLKFSPIRVLDPINPGFEISYERLYSRWSTQFSAALLADPFRLTGHSKYSGRRIAIEQKYFFIKSKKMRPYLSLDVVSHQMTIRRKDEFSPYPDGYLYDEDSTTYVVYNEEYRIEKQMVTVNAKIGMQANLGKVVLDFGIGVGIKSKNIQHLERTNINHFLVQGVDESPALSVYDRGKYITPNLPINFKVGFLF